jgi:hypothetical protein
VKNVLNFARLVGLTGGACFNFFLAGPLAAADQKLSKTETVIPRIELEAARLDDAIKNLTRMAGINYILDPRISISGINVSGRWENLSAEQVLGKVLQEHRLKIVENPATSVARIASSNQNITPVPTSQVGNETSKVIPVILVDDVKVDEAIKHIAIQAGLKVSFDPSLSALSAAERSRVFPVVSFRWENIAARQALAALLDNYGLEMVEDSDSKVMRIKMNGAKR